MESLYQLIYSTNTGWGGVSFQKVNCVLKFQERVWLYRLVALKSELLGKVILMVNLLRN